MENNSLVNAAKVGHTEIVQAPASCPRYRRQR